MPNYSSGSMTRVKVRLLLSALLLTPAAVSAEPIAIIDAMTQGLYDDPPAIGSAFAACVNGNGDPEVTATIFTDAGWKRTDDDEMGIVELTAGPTLFVTLYDGGRICSVYSAVDDTHAAGFTLKTFANVVGLPIAPVADDLDCTAFSLGDTTHVTVTSGGQDPVCDSETDSDTRFTFTRNDAVN